MRQRLRRNANWRWGGFCLDIRGSNAAKFRGALRLWRRGFLFAARWSAVPTSTMFLNFEDFGFVEAAADVVVEEGGAIDPGPVEANASADRLHIVEKIVVVG